MCFVHLYHLLNVCMCTVHGDGPTECNTCGEVNDDGETTSLSRQTFHTEFTKNSPKMAQTMLSHKRFVQHNAEDV